MDTLLRLCVHLTPSWTTQRTPLESLLDCIPTILRVRGTTFEGDLLRGFTASPLDCTRFINTLGLHPHCVAHALELTRAPLCTVAWKNQSQGYGEANLLPETIELIANERQEENVFFTRSLQ